MSAHATRYRTHRAAVEHHVREACNGGGRESVMAFLWSNGTVSVAHRDAVVAFAHAAIPAGAVPVVVFLADHDPVVVFHEAGEQCKSSI